MNWLPGQNSQLTAEKKLLINLKMHIEEIVKFVAF